jgi:hypothetical protein
MSKFMFIFRGGGIATPGVSPTDLQAHLKKWRDWIDALTQSGHSREPGNPLQNPGKTLRGRAGTMTDGPFAESKDMITGSLLIEAKSLDEAAELARQCPVFEYDGSVEVRPLLVYGG